MKLPLTWLKEQTPLTATADEIAATLVRLGHEVEGVEQPRAAVKGVRVGRIMEMRPHPDADKLKLLQVDIGEDRPLHIVCGASNMDTGDKVSVATVGTCLPNGLKIKKGNIRGQASFGMCCSEQELGLAKEAEGLLILAADAPVGAEVGEYLELEEAVFDLSITPNRGDCMNARGIARDLAADAGLPLAAVGGERLPVDKGVATPGVSITARGDCPVYLARRVEGVAIADSPAWMQAQLILAGQRPVNGVVDVLNYIMLHLGQPMHAFDADRVDGEIHIRSAAAGEPFEALDGHRLELADGDLVVADASSVLALAGIMGSEPSGVTGATTDIVLESAFFRPARVSLSRRSHAMVSEASMRFERGVDPAMVEVGMELATKMITELFGGRPGPVAVCGEAGKINADRRVVCDIKRLESRLGIAIPLSADAVLTRMGFAVLHRGGQIEVSVPSFRHDITIPEDMSEEYARIIGFDAIPSVLPPLTLGDAAHDQTTAVHAAVDGGFVQIVSYAFISTAEQRLFVAEDEKEIELQNPISEAMNVMRRSIWPGLLNAAKYNLNRQQPGVALVEQGRIYEKSVHGHTERNVIAWLMCGELQQDEWHTSSRQADFFDLKGALESWLASRGLVARFIADDGITGLQAGQSAKLLVGRTEVGRIGRVDAEIARNLDIDCPVFVAEVNLDQLPGGKAAKFVPLAEFPAIERDLVFLFERGTSADEILQAAGKAVGKLLSGVRIFDRYAGKGVPEGKVSLGLRFTLQDASRTLTQQDSDAAMNEVIKAMQQKFGASLRG